MHNLENESTNQVAAENKAKHHLRYLRPYGHLASVFGNDWFGQRAERFARYFGTPRFLITQTLLVAIWILLNATGVLHFDIYPFILLNLAFSLQAAYAAPLILLAQTRQADRDKAMADADAQHREELAATAERRQQQSAEQNALLIELLEQNTQLTRLTNEMSQRIETLSLAVHDRVVAS